MKIHMNVTVFLVATTFLILIGLAFARTIVFNPVLAQHLNASATATYVTAAETAAIAHRSPEMDQPVRVVDVGGYNVGIYVVRRLQEADQGCTIEHDTLALDDVTEILRVIDGSGTLVTGGTLLNKKVMTADDHDLAVLGPGVRGTPIQGGESRVISVGDEIIIPAGVPHGFSAIQTKSITYQVIRIDPKKALRVK